MIMAESGKEAGQKVRVFISYSRKDRDFAERLLAALESRDVEPKLDTRDLPKLEYWRRELLGFIREADAVVFIVSTHSVESPVCSWELEQVSDLKKRLAPVVLERVPDDRIPEAIAKINYLFFDPPNDFHTQADALAQALQTDLGWVKNHTRLGELARRWNERGRSRGLTLRGQELEEAEGWLGSRPRRAPEPTEETQAFIADSRRAARQRKNLLSASLGAGLLVALGLAGTAYYQRNTAVEQRNRALLTQSRFLTGVSTQVLRGGDAGTAMLLALEALPDPTADERRPYLREAEKALRPELTTHAV
jgi:hypothetical protein